jgi:hypothetical protein
METIVLGFNGSRKQRNIMFINLHTFDHFTVLYENFNRNRHLEGLSKVARVLHEEVGQEACRRQRALAEPPRGQPQEDAERLDQRHDAWQDDAFVQVGERQGGLRLGKLTMVNDAILENRIAKIWQF